MKRSRHYIGACNSLVNAVEGPDSGVVRYQSTASQTSLLNKTTTTLVGFRFCRHHMTTTTIASTIYDDHGSNQVQSFYEDDNDICATGENCCKAAEIRLSQRINCGNVNTFPGQRQQRRRRKLQHSITGRSNATLINQIAIVSFIIMSVVSSSCQIVGAFHHQTLQQTKQQRHRQQRSRLLPQNRQHGSTKTTQRMVLTTPESVIEQASTQNLLDDLIDESVRTSARRPIMMQFDPSSGWIWKRWKGTVFSETWDSCVYKMLYATGVFLLCQNAPVYVKENLAGFNTLWGQLLSVTTFTLTFFVNQSYALWRKCSGLSRRLQGRLNDLDMTLAAHATRVPTPPETATDDTGVTNSEGTPVVTTSIYANGSRQVLELVSRYVRLFNLLTYASFTRSHRPILTPRGMRRLVERGLMTNTEREVLVNADIPATQRHNAILLWIMRTFVEGCRAGHFIGESGFEQQFLEKAHVCRSSYGAIGDELRGRIPLAYAHIVQVLVDIVLWTYPFMAFSSGMSGFVCVLGTGLLTIGYQGLFDLAKQFLDPYDNENYGKGEDPLVVDTLIAETNAGSLRWLNGLQQMPVAPQHIMDGDLSNYLLPPGGYTVEELHKMEGDRMEQERQRELEDRERKKAEAIKSFMKKSSERMVPALVDPTSIALKNPTLNSQITIATNPTNTDLMTKALAKISDVDTAAMINDIMPYQTSTLASLVPDQTRPADTYVLPEVSKVADKIRSQSMVNGAKLDNISFGKKDVPAINGISLDDKMKKKDSSFIIGSNLDTVDKSVTEVGSNSTIDKVVQPGLSGSNNNKKTEGDPDNEFFDRWEKYNGYIDAMNEYEPSPHTKTSSGMSDYESKLSQLLADWAEEAKEHNEEEQALATYEQSIEGLDAIELDEEKEWAETEAILRAAPGADSIEEWDDDSSVASSVADESVGIDDKRKLLQDASGKINLRADNSFDDDTADSTNSFVSEATSDVSTVDLVEPDNEVDRVLTLEQFEKKAQELLDAEKEELLETQAIMNAPPGATAIDIPEAEDRPIKSLSFVNATDTSSSDTAIIKFDEELAVLEMDKVTNSSAITDVEKSGTTSGEENTESNTSKIDDVAQDICDN